MTPEVTTGHVPTTTWTKRICLHLPHGQYEKLRKGKNAQIMRDGQLYEIKPSQVPVVYDEKGKQITKARVS